MVQQELNGYVHSFALLLINVIGLPLEILSSSLFSAISSILFFFRAFLILRLVYKVLWSCRYVTALACQDCYSTTQNIGFSLPFLLQNWLLQPWPSTIRSTILTSLYTIFLEGQLFNQLSTKKVNLDQWNKQFSRLDWTPLIPFPPHTAFIIELQCHKVA